MCGHAGSNVQLEENRQLFEKINLALMKKKTATLLAYHILGKELPCFHQKLALPLQNVFC